MQSPAVALHGHNKDQVLASPRIQKGFPFLIEQYFSIFKDSIRMNILVIFWDSNVPHMFCLSIMVAIRWDSLNIVPVLCINDIT